LLDRIDLRVRVPRLTKDELLGASDGEASSAVRGRVELARARQRDRYATLGATCNAQLPGPVARGHARLDPSATVMLERAVDRLALTGRGFDRAIKVARTIADLAGADTVSSSHVAEALSYRGQADPEVRSGAA
jgi:magnesium chelatase family protein